MIFHAVKCRSNVSPNLHLNRKSVQLVPTTELMKGTNLSVDKKADTVDILKQLVNRTPTMKRKNSPLVRKPKVNNPRPQAIPPSEELKVLQTDEGFSWANENYNSWQRFVDIWTAVLSLQRRILLDNEKWTYVGGFSEDKLKRRRKTTASWLRERVLQLGPTFIKLGQLLSTRSDLFPREFIDELSKLQDRVPAFSPEKAKEIVAEELGAPVDILFKEFEEKPIATASLGQVHCAVLHNGNKVIVKVQRPGLKKLFDIDMQNLKLIARYLQRSKTLGGPTRDWISIYEESAKILYQEIDYINEAKNADRFQREFRNLKWVRVPLVYWDYTALKVLTMEYLPGIKINQLDILDSRGYNRSRIASRATEAYLIQVLKMGFFHADPHPGNIAVDHDEAIIYYDFGMMWEINNSTRQKLLNLFYSVYEKDVKKCLIDLGALQPTQDLTAVRRSVQFLLDNLLSQTPNEQQTLEAIGEDLFAITQDQLIRLPSTIPFVLKAFSTLEGVGYTLDPKFSFATVAAPYAMELLELNQK